MSRILLIAGILASIIFIELGFSIKSQIASFLSQNQAIAADNERMKQEIMHKELLPTAPAVPMARAFSLVINEIRFLQENSGTSMNVTLANSKDSDDISNDYIDSEYRGIKKLPILIQVDKSSIETDMAAVLNDVYALEVQTDFKVREINNDANTLVVKGDIYGI